MKQFDYIIVGAGAAGCVVANRLSENPSTRVLLLEAGGPDKNFLIHVPAGFTKLTGNSVNWGYSTVPQKEMNNREMHYPQGRTWGGSTSINAMIYIRGNRKDYDTWQEMGNAGWGYEGVLPYFKKSENNESYANEFHSQGGLLNVAEQTTHNVLTRAFVRSAQEIGIPYNADVNGAEQAGVTFYQVTQRNVRRESAATAFLKPALNRPNLTALTHTQAIRVIIESGKATGVVVRNKNGTVETINATTEVILSGGAINSPQLLLLSGIGPAEELKALGIEVMHDLPGVGKNLQDHMDVYIPAVVNQPVSYNGEDRFHKAILHGIQYLLYKTGPVTACVAEAGLFLKTSPEVRSPNIQIHCLPAYVVDHGRMQIKGHGITINTCHLRPKSIGSVTLASSNPLIAPRIDPNYCGDPEGYDWKMVIEGFRWGRRLLDAPSLKQYIAREYLPGSQSQTDEEVKQYIRQWSKTDYHPVGTCKMGSDSLAVVDTELRVHGLKGLRVIDASIMPALISGNTQAPSIMIGEKGAAIILEGKLV
jgi:choline dehydrogenase-like flavoprotein